MAQEVDRLEVAVRANAQTANSQLDLLIGKLNAVNSALRTVNAGGLQGLANAVYKFSASMQSMRSVGTADFTRLTNNIQKITSVNTYALNQTASAMNIMGSALSKLSGISTSVGQIKDVALALGKFGGVSVTRAIANMPLLADAVVKMMEALRTAPQVSRNLIDMTNALAGLTANGGKVATTVNSMNRYIRGTGTASHTAGKFLNLFRGHTVRAEKSSRNLASSIGLLYAKFWMLLRIFKGLGKTISSSMNFIETAHYFNVVMDKIGTENMNSFKQYGYDSAEAYKKSFNDRMQTLTGKMTGYTFDESGVATPTGTKSLGMDVNQLTNYQASILAVTNSLGLCGETAVNTAKAFSMLSSDMSSLRNVDLKTVMTNLTSGLIGQSRALYKYGIDITNNTLQQYAYANGIQKSVTEMTQAEKMQLRLLAILNQSRSAWGDMANTLNTPANQLRLIKQEFANLSRVIGNLFMGSVAGVLPYVNALIKALQRLFTWLANILGIDMSKFSSSIGTMDDAYADLIDDSDDFGDSLDKANAKAKELKNTVLGFDELNKMNAVNDQNAGAGNGIGDPTGLIDLEKPIADLVGEYEKVYNAAFERMEDRAREIADRICNAFKSKDFYGIGSFISTSISDALGGIRWESVYTKAAEIGTGMAEFINGLFKPELFKNLGSTIAGAINAAIVWKKELAKNLDFSGIGTAIREGITTFLKDIKWENIKESATSWARGLGTFLNSLIKPEFFSEVGQTIGDMLNTGIAAIFELGTTLDWENVGNSIAGFINKFLNTIDFAKAGLAVSSFASGVLKALVVSLGKIDWDMVGHALYIFIKNINWGEIFKNVIDIGEILFTGGFKIVASLMADWKLDFWQDWFGYTDEQKDKMREGMANETERFIDNSNPIALADPSKSKNRLDMLGDAFNAILGKDDDIGSITYRRKSGQEFSGGGRSLDMEVENDAKKDAEKIKDTTQKELTNRGSLGVSVSSSTPVYRIYDTLQKELSRQELVTGVKTNIDGYQLYEIVQNTFAKNDFYTGVKTSNTGQMIFNDLQKEIERLELKTGVKTNINGEQLYSALQKDFSAIDFSTGARSTTSGYEIYNKTQKEFNVNDFETETRSLTTGEEVYNFLQNNFSQNKLETQAGTTTNGLEIFNGLEDQFNKDFFKTGAESTTSGYEVYDEMQQQFGYKDLQTEADTTNSGYNLYDKIQSQYGQNTLYAKAGISTWPYDLWCSFRDAWNKLNPKLFVSVGYSGQAGTHLSAAGVLHGGYGRGFATGGFPDAGELFFARENGLPEMVGQFGNQTAVANNMQIIEGIKSGVTEAMMNVAMATSDNGKQKQRVEIPIYIGKKEVGRASYESMQDMVRSGEIKPVFQ